MGQRKVEMAALDSGIIALDDAEAPAVFCNLSTYSSKGRFGLNEKLLASTERFKVDNRWKEARGWLAERVGADDVLLAFSPVEVFRVSPSLFIREWENMLCPGRDDVIVASSAGRWMMSTATKTSLSSSRSRIHHRLGSLFTSNFLTATGSLWPHKPRWPERRSLPGCS
jgi:hypothetical protein